MHASPSLYLQLVQELAQLRRRVTVLEERLALQKLDWVTALELGKICGLNKRTLLRYASQGRLSEAAYRKTRRGAGTTYVYRFHRERALQELGLL